MHTSHRGLDLIKSFEGYSATPYLCPGRYWTIGVGHLITPADAKKFASGITEEMANSLLRQDVRVAECAVARFIKTTLTQNQFDALVSFTFNLGAAALQRSSLRQAINRGELHAVPAQLMRWVWAGGRKLPGLVRRRAAEGRLFASA